MTSMLCLDPNDEIIKCFAQGVNATYIDKKDLKDYDERIPVAFRSLTKRKLMHKLLETTNRDFYYIDNGYMGNVMKKKHWYRIVKNDIQHIGRMKEVPRDRWDNMVALAPWLVYHGQKTAPKNGPILLVTPSGKPCEYYGINRDEWVKNTTAQIKKYTDRPIIIRNKELREKRIANNSIGAQCSRDKIWAVVTYNSIAALEAVHYGIPAFTMAPHAGDVICNTDLSKIENPWYPDEILVNRFWHWIGYCQYTPREMMNGTAMRIQQEYDI